MTAFRITLIVLSTINLLFTLLTAAVGLFADGGDAWSRLIISGLHPLAAVAIVLLAYIPRPNITLVFAIIAILAINIISDISLAFLIVAETIKGDWPLPLVFSAIPTIAITYAVLTLRSQQHPPDDAKSTDRTLTETCS